MMLNSEALVAALDEIDRFFVFSEEIVNKAEGMLDMLQQKAAGVREDLEAVRDIIGKQLKAAETAELAEQALQDETPRRYWDETARTWVTEKPVAIGEDGQTEMDFY